MLSYLLSGLRVHLGLLQREEGQDLAEYALLIFLIALAVIVAVTALGTQISTIFSTIVSQLT